MSRRGALHPAVQIVDSGTLPRPQWDAWCEPGLVSDYYQVTQGYHIIRRRGTPTSYMVYTTAGSGFFRDARDRMIRVRRGDLVLVDARAYQEYGILPRAPAWRCHWVHFDAQPHWTHWLPLPKATGLSAVSFAHVRSRAAQRRLADLFFELHTERKRHEVWRQALALNVLERILIVAHGTEDVGTTRHKDPRIWRVLEAMERDAPRSVNVAAYAELAGLSPSRLEHLFKQQTGVSIRTAVNRVRLRAAQHALQESGVKLAEAAGRAGFESPYSFSNWFTRQTGMRPSEYRRRWLASGGRGTRSVLEMRRTRSYATADLPPRGAALGQVTSAR